MKKHKLLAVILALVMTLSILPTAALAENEFAEMTIDGVTTQYNDQGAFLAALSGAADEAVDIKLLDNLEIAGTVRIEEGQTVTLDLNGKALSTTTKPGDGTRHYYAIDNYGNFKLKDTGSNGSITARGIENLGNGVMTIESGKIISCDTNGGACIWNEADLTINGGTFETTYEGSSSDTYGPGCLISSGKVLITGGTFSSVNKRTYAIISDDGSIEITPGAGRTVTVSGAHGGLGVDGGVAVVNGGTYSSTDYYGLYVSNDGYGTDPMTAFVTVNGGTFDGLNYSVWIGSDYNDPVNSTIEINGGIYKKPLNAQECTREGAIVIKGGTFSADPRTYVPAEGYIVTEAGGKYTVEELTAANSEAKIGEKYYKTIAEAIADANNNEIVLLKNVEVSGGSGNTTGILTITKNLTLNGQGHSITAVDTVAANSSLINIQNGAHVTIENLTLDGNSKTKHGLNITSGNDAKTEVTLNGVTINNGLGYGIVCNSSELSATDLVTSGNAWGGVNVDNKTAQTAAFTMTSGTLNEAASLVVENGKNLALSATIQNGTFNGAVILQNVGNNENVKLDIQDGKFVKVAECTKTEGQPPVEKTEGLSKMIQVSGGLFKTAPAEQHIAGGMKVMDSGNSSYPYTVGIGVSGVSLDKSSASIAIGEKETLTATVAPESATNKSVTWASSNTSVATVSGGTVTGVAPGTATITVTTVDGSKTATCEVTVLDKFAVKFESAQGTAPEAQTVVQGKTIDLPDAPEDVDTTVYVFNGWKLGDEIYQPTSVSEKAYTVTGSVTFVAQWNKIVVPANPEEAGSTQIEVTTGETNTSIENVPEDQKEAAEQIADALAYITVLGEEALTDAATEVAQDQDIVDAAIDDAQDKGVTAGEGETLTVVVKTYMDIEVKSVDENAVVLDITPRYDVIVSNGTSEHKAVEGEKLEVSGEISITLPLPAALASVENIYVRHVKEDGTVYYYKAVKNEGAGTITFTNPHGFSEFTLISDSRTATVNFNGTSKTLTPADVGAELSDNYTVPSGKRFGGWKFEGIDGTYTTLTDDLLTALAEPESPITAEPVFSNRSSGGSSGSSSYTASVDSGIKHGTVTVSPKSASKGTTVTITVKPDTGYELDDLTVTDKNGDTVKLTRKSDTKYTFTMPASKVTIDADFVKIEEAPAHSFVDVPDGFWAEDAIIWAYENGYMKGTSETTFGPSGNVSRQQLWMILARLSGASPATMAEAKSWAVANGVSDGSSPSGSVTRQQMVTILCRYATLMGYDVSAKADLTVYPDYASVASYAQDAMAWAVANGIVGGTSQGTLNPAGTASRAQFAVILSRFCEKMA